MVKKIYYLVKAWIEDSVRWVALKWELVKLWFQVKFWG